MTSGTDSKPLVEGLTGELRERQADNFVPASGRANQVLEIPAVGCCQNREPHRSSALSRQEVNESCSTRGSVWPKVKQVPVSTLFSVTTAGLNSNGSIL